LLALLRAHPILHISRIRVNIVLPSMPSLPRGFFLSGLLPSLSSSLCRFLHFPVTSSPLRHILEKPQPIFLSQYETKFHIRTKQAAKL
jgi:hypothetical protein